MSQLFKTNFTIKSNVVEYMKFPWRDSQNQFYPTYYKMYPKCNKNVELKAIFLVKLAKLYFYPQDICNNDSELLYNV